jgi:very-short-patch-repair endonuclease
MPKRNSKATVIAPGFWLAAGLPVPVPEFKFHPTRRWRFDYAWPDRRLAVEIEGAVWVNGRHTRGAGYLGDMQKYNSACVMGWRVLRYPPNGIDFAQIRDAINT